MEALNNKTEEPTNVKITKTKKNMLQILTENMAQMEARIKQLEGKDMKNTKEINDLQKKFQEMLQNPTTREKRSKSSHQAGPKSNASNKIPKRKC